MGTASYFCLEIDDYNPAPPKWFGPAGGLQTRSLGVAPTGPARPPVTPLKVVTLDLTAREAADTRRSDRVRMIERAFPIRLLKPMGDPVPAAPGAAAWGLGATMWRGVAG